MSDDKPSDEFPADDTVEILDLSELIDAHLERNEFADDVPTKLDVRPICPGCGKEQVRLEDTDQPPASHAQAWRDGGACRGNASWFWCRAAAEHSHVGTLTIMPRGADGAMDVLFFPDRRKETRPVDNDRRGK